MEPQRSLKKPAALRRDFPLGGFGSQGSKGALTPSRKPPSQHKVGRVLVGNRREERKGQNTALEKWLTSGQGRKGTDRAKIQEGDRSNFEEVGKEEGRNLEGKSPKKGREGRGDFVPRGRKLEKARIEHLRTVATNIKKFPFPGSRGTILACSSVST